MEAARDAGGTVTRAETNEFAQQSTTAAEPNGSEYTATADVSRLPKTKLIFHSAFHQQTYENQTQISSVYPLASLPQADQGLFKIPSDIPSIVFAIVTESTIFHPQGGGQPSDVGEMEIQGVSASNTHTQTFKVITARTSATNPGVVLHFGYFADENASDHDLSGAQVRQVVDAEKRKLFSRLHTAGHVLGTATRTLLEKRIDNFDELKASHFPDSAACEFQGLIDGKFKPEIQTAVDELVDKDAQVQIGWWTKSDFRQRGLERLLPSDKDWKEIAIYVDENGDGVDGTEADDEKTRIRVVDIVGAEVYPCGGTHVPSTKACGKVTVRKISRQKGNSRVSYLVD